MEEARKLAKANQRPGQTKEQTKLIAQGIQKGIEQYKKQHKAKSRELDKQLKSAIKAKQNNDHMKPSIPESPDTSSPKQAWLPWCLLIVSWGLFIAYLNL